MSAIDRGIVDLNSKITVSELLKVYPSTIRVFFERKMLCVGCPTEAFHTLEDVARINRIALENLLADLREAIGTQGKTGS